MDNVVSFPTRRKEEEEPTGDKSTEFLRNHLLPWAESLGLDTNSRKFKLNGATIMTCIQGMLLDDI